MLPAGLQPPPLRLSPQELSGGKYDEADRNRLVGGIRLSDGGVYDNLGLEPVWKSFRVVLVSDGGAVFEAEPDTGLLWRMKRYSAIVGRGASAVCKRWLISSFVSGQLQGTTSPAAPKDLPDPPVTGRVILAWPLLWLAALASWWTMPLDAQLPRLLRRRVGHRVAPSGTIAG